MPIRSSSFEPPGDALAGGRLIVAGSVKSPLQIHALAAAGARCVHDRIGDLRRLVLADQRRIPATRCSRFSTRARRTPRIAA
jgi:hypothetical protein